MNENWKKVKESFIFKTDLVLKLTNKLKVSNKIDKSELEKTENYSRQLKKACTNNSFNKEAIKEVKEKTDLLNSHLARILVELEFDFKLKKQEAIFSLCDQLAAIENKIYAEIKKYNQICKNQNKEELMYNVAESKSPSVEF